MKNKIDFYEEVEISSFCKERNKKYIGKRGGVMGISEEGGMLYGYSVKLYDEELLLSFDSDEVVSTGRIRTQEDYY